jgi:hypothetical protein
MLLGRLVGWLGCNRICASVDIPHVQHRVKYLLNASVRYILYVISYYHMTDDLDHLTDIKWH